MVFLALFGQTTSALAQPAVPVPSSSSNSPPPASTPDASSSTESPEASPVPPEATSKEEASDVKPQSPPVNEQRQAEAKKAAKEKIKKAIALYNKREYSQALSAYLSAYRIYPSYGARVGAGTCLVKLQRYDEAQESYELALRDFGAMMPEATKKSALEQIDAMRTVTGSLMVTDAEIGSLVVVDGRVRGEHPLPTPMSVLEGSRLVRVYREGFELFEAGVDVKKGEGQTLSVKLKPLAQARTGILRVGEAGGRKMEIVVDGVPVGMTPWEGPVSAGEHSVVLRAPAGTPQKSGVCGDPVLDMPPFEIDADEWELASAPTLVVVKPQEATPVQLKAEVRSSTVKIIPSAADADVYVDGAKVSRGGFDGRLPPGEHLVKVVANGYVERVEKIRVSEGEDTAIQMDIKKDYNAPRWVPPAHFMIEFGGSAPITPSLGGELAASCTEGCIRSLAVGGRVMLRAGYELGRGLGFGLTGGYLSIQQSIAGRKTILTRTDGTATEGIVSDALSIRGVMLGAYGGYRLGEKWPLRLGVSAGVGFGPISSVKTGLFGDVAVGPLTQSSYFAWMFVEPEMRVGVRVSEHLGLGLSVSGLMLIAPKVPQWNGDMRLDAHNDKDLAYFKPETIMGSTMFALTEGVHVSYAF